MFKSVVGVDECSSVAEMSFKVVLSPAEFSLLSPRGLSGELFFGNATGGELGNRQSRV